MKYIKISLKHIKEIIILQFRFANGGNVAANERLAKEHERARKIEELRKKK